jgi:TetR/AcrR family transcriptional repressor of nem operon
MELFWTRGHEATSVTDLTSALGVHPGTLYRIFGDKHALFLRAFAHYRERLVDDFAPTLLEGAPVLSRIRAVLIGWIDLAVQQDQCSPCSSKDYR